MSQRLSLRGPLLVATAVSLLLIALFYVLPTRAQARQGNGPEGDRCGRCGLAGQVP